MNLFDGLPRFNSEINSYKKTIYPNRVVYTQEGNPWKVVVNKETLIVLNDFDVVFLKVDLDSTLGKKAEAYASLEACGILIQDLVYRNIPMPNYVRELEDILRRPNGITMIEFRFDNPYYQDNR